MIKVDKFGELTDADTLGERLLDPIRVTLNAVAIAILLFISAAAALGWFIGMFLGVLILWSYDGRPRYVSVTGPTASATENPFTHKWENYK